MTQENIVNAVSEMPDEDLAAAVGGMKWDHNYVSSDVIDARGGQLEFWGFTFTFDVDGNVSSVTRN